VLEGDAWRTWLLAHRKCSTLCRWSASGSRVRDSKRDDTSGKYCRVCGSLSRGYRSGAKSRIIVKTKSTGGIARDSKAGGGGRRGSELE
jgi:hypothetical protein